LWAKRKYNIPFIFDMRGFWADERIDGKIWNINKWIHKKAYQYFKKKEKDFLQESAYTVSLTKCGKQEIKSWKLPLQSAIKVIPCCTDEALFNKDNIRDVRSDLGISTEDFVISYSGSIGTWYMLEEMLDFFKVLNAKNKNAKFLFVTKDNPQQIIDVANQKKIPINNIIIIASSREMMPSKIQACNFSIFFIKPYYSKKASSPTKMGEIMNMGIPIVCNAGVGDVDLIINKSMPELLINEFSKKEYNRVVDLILKTHYNSNKIIAVAKQYFSLQEGIENYYNIYQSI
jgi:glycosyltransferase involved in cell wall biosynthesis